jgi:hypothetical protein
MQPISAIRYTHFESTLISKVDSIVTTAQIIKFNNHSAAVASPGSGVSSTPSPGPSKVAVGQASMETLGCLEKERAKPTTKPGLAVATTLACSTQFARLKCCAWPSWLR